MPPAECLRAPGQPFHLALYGRAEQPSCKLSRNGHVPHMTRTLSIGKDRLLESSLSTFDGRSAPASRKTAARPTCRRAVPCPQICSPMCFIVEGRRVSSHTRPTPGGTSATGSARWPVMGRAARAVLDGLPFARRRPARPPAHRRRRGPSRGAGAWHGSAPRGRILSSGLSWVILLGLTIVSSFQSFLGRTDILG